MAAETARAEKIKIGSSFRRALVGLLSPAKIVRAIRLHRARRSLSRTMSDEGLKFYSEILPGDFLHFGFFEDPNTNPREISLADLERAQLAFTRLFIERMHDKKKPVLDVGCGMGGLSARLAAEGFVPVALTPDVHQIAYIKEKYPAIELIRGRFEDLDAAAHARRFGTIINSESLQYLDLEKSAKLVAKLLAPGGRWLIADFFKTSEAYKGSGHVWENVKQVLAANGLLIVFERDITPNTAVTLRYIHMLAEGVMMPIMRLGTGKLARKQPGIHSMFKDFIDDLFALANYRIEVMSPEKQLRERRYIFIEVARAEEAGKSLH
jgi:2-polyprenyl-3-methyl-5-hydroxy-6-metoxy-1,4-benzoquinol methylase